MHRPTQPVPGPVLPARARRAARVAGLALACCSVLAGAQDATTRAQGGSDRVTLYRCTDSRGQLSVQDTPCQAGARQQTVQMQRPQDPPPRVTSTAAPEAVAAPAIEREVRVVMVQPPQPMYVCTAPDGDEYISDDGEGNPRWVPFWTTAWGVAGPRPPHPPRPPLHGPRPPGPPTGPGLGPGPRPSHPVVVPVAAGGTWVRDPCQRLPQQEVCRRLSDRRYEILRIYGAGMPSDRRALDLEQQGIDARMGSDCPGY